MVEEAHYPRHRPHHTHFQDSTQRESLSIPFVPPFLGPRTGTGREASEHGLLQYVNRKEGCCMQYLNQEG